MLTRNTVLQLTKNFTHTTFIYFFQKNWTKTHFIFFSVVCLRSNYMPEVSARGVGSQEQRALSEEDPFATRMGPSSVSGAAFLPGLLSSHDLQLCSNPPAQHKHACGQVCRRPHLPPDAGSSDCCSHQLFVPLWPAVSSGLHPQAASIHVQFHCVSGLHQRALAAGRLHL